MSEDIISMSELFSLCSISYFPKKKGLALKLQNLQLNFKYNAFSRVAHGDRDGAVVPGISKFTIITLLLVKLLIFWPKKKTRLRL